MPCPIEENWAGPTVGRRCCLAHGLIWDDGGPCPTRRPGNERRTVYPTFMPHPPRSMDPAPPRRRTWRERLALIIAPSLKED